MPTTKINADHAIGDDNPGLRVLHVAATANGAAWMHQILRELRARGHDASAVIAGAHGDLARRLERDGIPYHVLDLDVFSSANVAAVARKLWALFRLLRRLQPDVVHYHLFPSIVLGRLAGWLADVPVRFSMIPGPYYLEAPILGQIDARTAWADTTVIASCEYTRTLYAQHGVPRAHVDLIYYGTDARAFDPAHADGQRVRRECGLGPATPTVGIVAYFYPPLPDGPYTPRHLINRGIKGHDVLLRAVPAVLADVPDATFLLVGEGWGEAGAAYERQLKDLASELGIAHAVRFTGARADVPDTLAAFDVSIQCSLSENLGGSIESLLMARPLVVTAIGGLVDSVRHEETGLQVPPDDPAALAAAIVRLLEDRALGGRLGEAGRRLALERFTLTKTVDDIEALYREKARAASPGGGRPRGHGYRATRTFARGLALPFKVWTLLALFLGPRRHARLRAWRQLASRLFRRGAIARSANAASRSGAPVTPGIATPAAPLRKTRVVQVAGATQNAQWLVDICRQLRDDGHEVSAVIGYPAGNLAVSLEQAGIPYQAVRLSFSPQLGRARVFVYLVRVPMAIWQLTSYFRQARADVVHAHIFNTVFMARIAAWIVRVPCRVSMVPGPLHLEAPLTREADRLTAWMDHRVIAGSEWTRDRYRKIGLKPPRLACIPYGADAERFNPARADGARVRRELGIPEGAPVVGLVAYFYPPRIGWHTPAHLRGRGIKGHEDFMSAAHRVRAVHPAARFVLTGAGWGDAGEAYRQRLISRCRDEGLGEAVVFTGHRDDVADVLAAMNVAVQCSFSENYGGTIESLLMAIPTVATRVGGMPETVRDGETGLLVPPGDPDALAAAILSLIADPARARRFALAGRSWMLERFQATQTATSIAQLYRDCQRDARPA